MIEGVIAGVIGNFLTDFTKKLLRWKLVFEDTEKAREYIPVPEQLDIDVELYIRRAINQERRANISAVLSMLLWLALFLLGGAYLPIALQNFSEQMANLSATRLSWVPWSFSKVSVAIIFGVVFYIPGFIIAQWITQKVAGYIHHEWGDVSRERYVRLFIISLFLLVIPYSGLVIYSFDPTITYLEAVKLPAIFLGGMFAFALLNSRS